MEGKRREKVGLYRKEKNEKKRKPISLEDAQGRAREYLLYLFPWLRKKEKGEASFRLGSGADLHGKYTVAEQVSFATLVLTLIDSAILAARYAAAFMDLEKTVVTNNPFLIILIAVLPFIVWVRATDEKFWAYHKRKRLFFALACVHAALVILQPLYSLIWTAAVPLVVGKITITAAMTKRAVVLLAYIIEAIMAAVAVTLIYRVFEPLIKSEAIWRSVELFKLQHVRDSRKNAENRYDVTAITNLEDGKPIRIKENDRFVQTVINGASGTGKTSSIFLNVIKDDLDTKFKNRDLRQEKLLAMITEGRATIQGPLAAFDESAVIAVGKTKQELKKNEKELAAIRNTYPDCGITVVAPNSDLNENIIRMCAARHFNVNVLDPVTDYSSYGNVREMAINPFYLPTELNQPGRENERVIRISQQASAFADVLIATNQMGGSSDVYFTDISLSVSSNVAAVVMLAKNIDGAQTYIDDVHDCISNFDNLEEYVETIETHYGIKIEIKDPKQAGGQNKGYGSGYASLSASADDTDPDALLKARKNPYYQQLLFVRQELLGPGREAMFSQARGLRNLITKILQDPRIKRKLSADDNTRIDFDAIMSKNEVTLVSTAVELGQSVSTSFGIFFLLLFRTSMLRRPKATRTPHFLWCDEASQYCHPMYDDYIALARQYKIAFQGCLQTLTQLEKHRETAYLKNVFLGAGTHIVFGRLAVEEMELYSKMAGIVREKQAQQSETDNSLLASNPTHTESTRWTPTMTNVMEGSDMRLLDFQELTIFTISDGRVLPGMHARVFFLSEDAYDPREWREIDWRSVVPEAFSAKSVEKRRADEKKKTAAEKKVALVDDEINPADEGGVVSEKTEVAAIEENKKEDELIKLVEESGDLSEIYAKLSSGEW
jgi:hypothetical protein